MALDSRTVLITGGHGDLAQELVRAFKSKDWQTLSPGKQELDVTSEQSVASYFSSLSSLDILVNNAGVIDDQYMERMSPGQWDHVVRVSLTGAFLCTRAAVKLMKPQGRGHVLFISSRAARYGSRGQSNYASAKAGLIGLAQSLAKEHGMDNLCFNVIFPGFLETKMTQHLPTKTKSAALDQHALKRFNTVPAAARTIVDLALMENVSGQVFQLDSRVDAWT